MNKSLLLARMMERNVSVDELCHACGFSRTAFYRKVNGKSEFVQSEISAAKRLLNLSLEQTAQIFGL